MTEQITTSFRFDKKKKRLFVYGSNADTDILTIKNLFKEGKIKITDLDAILYQKNRTSTLSYLIRGKYLEDFLNNIQNLQETPQKSHDNFKTILRQINESSKLESIYIGLLVFSLDTKKFLFTLPKKSKYWIPLGGNPLDLTESATDTICCISKNFDINLLPEYFDTGEVSKLKSILYDNITYDTYIVFVEHEYKPSFPNNISEVKWFKINDKTPFHPVYKELFNSDDILKQLTDNQDINFESIIEDIITNGKNDGDDPDPPPRYA